MVSVKVIPEKGVEYSVYEKNGKHRVYFKVTMEVVALLRSAITTLLKASFSPQEAQPLYGMLLRKTTTLKPSL